MNKNADDVSALSLDELEHVAGGQTYRVGAGLTRSYVDSLKGFAANPNLQDGFVANSLRGNLTGAVTSKPRPWLGGTSIDVLTKPMQYTNGKGLPTTR